MEAWYKERVVWVHGQLMIRFKARLAFLRVVGGGGELIKQASEQSKRFLLTSAGGEDKSAVAS